MAHDIVLIPGDGIGPEVTAAAQQVLEAAGADIRWHIHRAGQSALDQDGELLPDATLDAIREFGVGMKGPCTTPVGGGFSSVNVAIRKRLNLYGAMRPVRSMAGVPTRFENVDLVVIRENTEGLYSGIENEITEGVVTSLKVATEKACTRIAKFAFDYAVKRGRKRVTALHKANIMKLTDGMFIRCAKEVHESGPYSSVIYDEVIIDAGCMRIVRNPTDFDVLLCENLYGDLMSDLCAGLVGGLGVTPGANIGDDCAVFEAVHGTAPDIAGKGVANPLAMIMSSVMMLNHMAEQRDAPDLRAAADRIKDAYNGALEAGEKTRDLGGGLDTAGFARALIARV